MKIFKIVKDINRIKLYFFGLKIFSTKKKSEGKKILAKNLEIKDTAIGKRAFLLATGPSVKEQDISKLAGEDCFSLSNFFLHKDINLIKPKLHFFAPYHPPLVLENYIDWLKLADEKLPKETNMVLGLSNKHLVEQYNLFPNRKIYYLDLQAIEIFQTDLEKPVRGPQTGPIMILPVLDYMGYSEINLIGCDMNRMRNYQATTENFYCKDVDIRQNATDGEGWADIITELKRTCVMFEQFKAYQDLLEGKGKKIYNLSKDSWLDFIPKKHLEDL